MMFAPIRAIGTKNPFFFFFLSIWHMVSADFNLHYLSSVPTLSENPIPYIMQFWASFFPFLQNHRCRFLEHCIGVKRGICRLFPPLTSPLVVYQSPLCIGWVSTKELMQNFLITFSTLEINLLFLLTPYHTYPLI